MLYIFKSISVTLPVSFQYFFVLNKNINNYSTRYSNNVRINSCATQERHYSIVIAVPKSGMRFNLKYESWHLFIFSKSNSNCVCFRCEKLRYHCFKLIMCTGETTVHKILDIWLLHNKNYNLQCAQHLPYNSVNHTSHILIKNTGNNY